MSAFALESTRLSVIQENTATVQPGRSTCLRPRFSGSPILLMNEVDLPPLEFAQFLVAQFAVQVHHEGGEHVLAPQLRCFRQHARLLVGGVGASRRWRERDLSSPS